MRPHSSSLIPFIPILSPSLQKITYLPPLFFSSLAASSESNFYHKLLLIRAECARVSLILGSTAIFQREGMDKERREEAKKEGGEAKQDFQEAMELYESAIKSARTHGFAQYEALGLELFALFWLTATSCPKEHVASGYVFL